jgi:hypothetical protein
MESGRGDCIEEGDNLGLKLLACLTTDTLLPNST